MSFEFEWDPKKTKANAKKHGVTFKEGMSVFTDPLAKIFNDEKREIIIGHSINKRLILVSFAELGTRIRIISAREETQTERRDYKENAES